MNKHNAKEITTVGNWRLYYKPWSDGIRCRMVLRKLDKSIDITNEGKEYKIYSKLPIAELTYYKKSTSKLEKRPYFYLVSKEEVLSSLDDLDESLISRLSPGYFDMNELNM